MPTSVIKGVVTLSGLVALIPGAIRDLLLVAVLFIALDTVSGWWLAARRGRASSHRLRGGLVPKLLQYSLIIALATGVAIITHQWAVFGAGIGAVIAVEAASMLENLIQIEQNGGAPLGPARPFLQRLARYFAVASNDGLIVTGGAASSDREKVNNGS